MTQHNDAIVAFRQGRTAEALRLLEELLAENDSAEYWNDWAAIHLSAGDLGKTESGFTRALELDPQNVDAAANLGLLLLGRGAADRAVPLLTQVLPALPPEQQKIVMSLLAEQEAGKLSGEPDNPAKERRLRVLVINDADLDPETNIFDRAVMELLLAWRETGDEVTFIARQIEKNSPCESTLHQAGIHTYENDAERLLWLGIQAAPASWSFRELMEQNQFDVAILNQRFRHGVSIPEHYLQDLRRHSPETRIVIFADELQAGLSASDGCPLATFEAAADWSMRQREAFERADAVIFPDGKNAAELAKSGPTEPCEVVPHQVQKSTLAKLRRSMLSVVPKRLVEEDCSVMLAEKQFQELLDSRPLESRFLSQLECHVRLAERLLSEGKPEKAREQLRHIFGRAPEMMLQGSFASQVLIVLKRCYRSLGDPEMAERCAVESRRCVTLRSQPLPSRKRAASHGPAFSVIVPTFNRLAILRKCLAALEAQTLASDDFEVIVIDDGSSDGTQQALSRYHPPFHFQYLRQSNSGTGAARRNGVQHAVGDYLLLMNDDTISDRDLLKQHLQVQRAHPGERWAVLGNFEYPAAARQRALTQYFSVEPFMFPQVSMEDGCPYGYSHFITCNLSVNREAVMEAGSFESIYKLSEDTELGIRLYEQGYRVLYHPPAHAFHDHLPYPARNLIRRARVYGADYFYMFGRHPRVMKDWAMPVKLTAMDEVNATRVLAYVEENRKEVEQAVAAVERWDGINFETLLAEQPETAALVLDLFRQAVPAIHWFYLFETMLHTMIRELELSHLGGPALALQAARGAGA